jgi:ribosomal protein S18 acetylase RimI-like enzyme
VNVRPAAASDADVLRELWEEFETEFPEPGGFVSDTWEEMWNELREEIDAGLVFVVEDGDGPLGFADAHLDGPERVHVETVFVRPRGRRSGAGRMLLAEVVKSARGHGATLVTLEVLDTNHVAREVWSRLGFAPVSHLLAQPLEALETRLGGPPEGPSRATTHVQTDDRVSVERALAQFVPRLPGAEVRDAADGWIRIADPQLDTDRDAQSRLAAELSERLGAVVVALALERGAVVRFKLYELGRMVDEYLSVPDFYGVLPRGDELALEANATLVARLTGADREQVRRVARTAADPAGLPPAEELYEQIARLMRLEP